MYNQVIKCHECQAISKSYESVMCTLPLFLGHYYSNRGVVTRLCKGEPVSVIALLQGNGMVIFCSLPQGPRSLGGGVEESWRGLQIAWLTPPPWLKKHESFWH